MRRTTDHQAPLSMEFSRQEYWSGLSFSTPGNLPDPELGSLGPPALEGRFFTSVLPGKPLGLVEFSFNYITGTTVYGSLISFFYGWQYF